MTHSWQQTVRVIVISLLIGSASGVLATALTTSYLSQYAFELSKLTEPLRLTKVQPRAVPQGYEDALSVLETESLQSVGLLFPPVIPPTGFIPDDQVGSVVALTSDGWMLSGTGSVASVVHVGDQTCVVDEVREHFSGLAFLHCPFSNVSVVDLGEGNALAPGDQVFVVEGPSDLIFTHVKSVSWAGERLRSSDVPTRRVHLAYDGILRNGSPVFTISGELVGLLESSQGESLVIPFEQLAGAFEQVLQGDEELATATLGVNVIDLARTVGLSSNMTRGFGIGALLHGSLSIEKGSAAQTAGFLTGDIILSVDGETVGEAYTLDDLIARFSPGDAVTLTIDRAGERMDVVATLGSSLE